MATTPVASVQGTDNAAGNANGIGNPTGEPDAQYETRRDETVRTVLNKSVVLSRRQVVAEQLMMMTTWVVPLQRESAHDCQSLHLEEAKRPGSAMRFGS